MANAKRPAALKFVSQFSYEFILTRTGEKKTKLLESLSTYEYQTNFHQTRKKRHVNTATWLFSTPEFAKWKDSDTSSVFILTGKRKFTAIIWGDANLLLVGSGKTVLTLVLPRLSMQAHLLTSTLGQVLLKTSIASE